MAHAKPLVLLLTLFAGVAHAEPPATPAQADAPAPTSTPGAAGATTNPAASEAQKPPPAPSAPSASAPPVAPAALAPQQPVAPAAAAPQQAAAAAPQQAAAAAPPVASADNRMGGARVRFAVDHPDAWLEARPFGGFDAWRRACKAPCGDWIGVEGNELRVTAERMTPSSAFRIEPGSGSALLSVKGGSSLARSLGRVGLVAGIPISLVGMTGFAYGRFDDRSGLETAGAIALGAGALLVVAALPLLVAGSTSVRNEKGDLIANAPSSSAF